MSEATYIISAKRTPIGQYLGSLNQLSAAELGVIAAKAALSSAHIEASECDEVIVGNVLSASAGMGLARQISIAAGMGDEVPAYSLNMVCGSGMKSIGAGYAQILAGLSDIVLCLGTESMSQAAFISPSKIRKGNRHGNLVLADEIVQNGLTDAFFHYPVGMTAENIAARYHLSRLQQDNYALESHNRAAFAQTNGAFINEIVPVNSEHGTLGHDEAIHSHLTMEQLHRLPPAFKENGSVTAGNATGFNDGASAVLLASEAAVARLNLQPMAEIIAFGQGGVAPDMMGLGSIPAISQALERADLALSDMRRMELNESFAAQSLAVIHELSEQHEIPLDWFPPRVNPTGGSLALGHPLGCSGNRIVTTLVHGLAAESQTYGLAAICIGGGMGNALIIKSI